MNISSGTITGLLGAAATVAGALGYTGVSHALADPTLVSGLLAIGALFSAIGGLLPGHAQANAPAPVTTAGK